MQGPFTAEHERLRDEVRRFVASELHPHADVWERRGRLPRRALTACAARGWFSLDPWGHRIAADFAGPLADGIDSRCSCDRRG